VSECGISISEKSRLGKLQMNGDELDIQLAKNTQNAAANPD
jgi:hypothetical protein